MKMVVIITCIIIIYALVGVGLVGELLASSSSSSTLDKHHP